MTGAQTSHHLESLDQNPQLEWADLGTVEQDHCLYILNVFLLMWLKTNLALFIHTILLCLCVMHTHMYVTSCSDLPLFYFFKAIIEQKGMGMSKYIPST